MTTLRAFHGDPDIKEIYLQRVVMHREADALVQGQGWENGRGCAVGCTLEAYDHTRYPIELGVPVELAHLEDVIFEGLPSELAMAWPERFLTAIPVGADLSRVWNAFAHWMLVDPEHGVRRLVVSEAPWAHQVRAAIDAVASLHATSARSRSVAESAWSSAGATAESAAAPAAAAAARSAASAAWSAAWSARSPASASAASAARAAESAADSAARAEAAAAPARVARAADSAWYVAASEELLRLLSEAKP